jgi:integrase
MTTTVVTAPDNPFTAAQIAQALLHLDDAPDGFRLGALSQSSALTSLCGKAPVLSAVPSANQANIVFVHPDGTVISERINAFRNNRVAEAFMTTLRAQAIPRLVAEELHQHRNRFPSDPLVFTSAQGTQLRANNLRRRAWARAVLVAGLNPAPTFHDMRHTAVSLWIAAGGTDLEIAKWAGHRSVSFTKDRYAHLFPEHGEVLAGRLDAFIAAATATPAAPISTLPPIPEVRRPADGRS